MEQLMWVIPLIRRWGSIWFFFKQKTAYDIVSRDWSSDVCSSDLDFRDPLNPADPADSQTMTFPSLSVSATIVLLNDVLMCACPIAMFFRTRRRVRPRAAVFRGGAIYVFAVDFLPRLTVLAGPLRVRAFVRVR